MTREQRISRIIAIVGVPRGKEHVAHANLAKLTNDRLEKMVQGLEAAVAYGRDRYRTTYASQEGLAQARERLKKALEDLRAVSRRTSP